MKIVFPIHPRTVKALADMNLSSRLEKCKNLKLIQPVGYVDFIKLMRNAITIRENTEWRETVDAGWNILTGTNTNLIVRAARESMPLRGKRIKPIFGNGNTSNIIKNTILSMSS